MSRTIMGSVAAGVLMFVLGWVFYGSPLYPMLSGDTMAAEDPEVATMVMGLVQLIIVGVALGMLLNIVQPGVRMQALIWAAAAAMLFTYLGNPIWEGADWRTSIYAAATGFAMLWAGGWVLMRWFLPASAS